MSNYQQDFPRLSAAHSETLDAESDDNGMTESSSITKSTSDTNNKQTTNPSIHDHRKPAINNTITTTTTTTTPQLSTPSPTTAPTTQTQTPLFKTLTPHQKLLRRKKLSLIRKRLAEKTVDELTDLYNRVEDPDFRVLISGVYHEGCMDRLRGWGEML